MVEIGPRSVGVLTGSRSACEIGRVPLLDAAMHRLHVWNELGLQTDTHTFSMATFVDNIFSAADNAQSAVAIVEDVRQWLRQRWRLELKEGSLEALPALGGSCRDSLPPGWACVRSMRCVGHILTLNGFDRARFRRVSPKNVASVSCKSSPRSSARSCGHTRQIFGFCHPSGRLLPLEQVAFSSDIRCQT